MTPYYEHAGVTIYHGDCRDVLPAVSDFDAVITDPVWPNADRRLAGADDPAGLFATALGLIVARRIVVQLGCCSDPRFLAAVPGRWPFIRACWLEYACPSYSGRVLNTGDLAYIFGQPPSSQPGRRVLPGRIVSTGGGPVRGHGRNRSHKQFRLTQDRLPHPAPRHLAHVRWLVRWFAEGRVLDPFAGTGTTLVAAKNAGLPVVGIEIEERYCEIAARRLAQEVLPL